MIKAWWKPGLVIIPECYWTTAAKHADIILSITTSFERNDLTMTGDYSNQYLVSMEQVIEPRFEVHSDFNVFADLAEMLKSGGKVVHTEGKNEVMWLKQFYDVAQRAAHAQRAAMSQFNTFWRQNKLIEMYENEKNNKYVRYADFRSDPVMNALGMPSGRIEIYSKMIEGYQYEDCPPHASWVEPDGWKGTADKDQLQLLTTHPAHHLHSQSDHASLHKEYVIANCEPVTIHPDDAKARGIAEGNLVRARSACGQVLVRAHVGDGIKPDIVCIHEGAWPGIEGGIHRNGGANVLTADIPTSRLVNGCAGNISLIYAGKYTGEASKLTVFDESATVTI